MQATVGHSATEHYIHCTCTILLHVKHYHSILVVYILLLNILYTVLKFSGSIGSHWPAQCPVFVGRNALERCMQKSRVTSGLPSIMVFSMIIKFKYLKSLNSSVLFVKSLFGDYQLTNNSCPFSNLLIKQLDPRAIAVAFQ